MFIDTKVLSKLQEEFEIPDDYDAGAARQRLADAQAARAEAQDSEILQAGLQAEDSTIVSLVNKVASPLKKRFRLDGGAAMALVQKVYKEHVRPNTTDDEFDMEDDEKWLQFFDGQFHELPLSYQATLREYFRNRAKLHRKLDARAMDDQVDSEDVDTAEGHGAEGDTARFDLIGSLSSRIEFAVEIGKHLRPKDILNLYCVSRDFHNTINGFLTSSMRAWTEVMAPSSAKIFPFEIYKGTCILDPVGRLDDPAEYHTKKMVFDPKPQIVTTDERTTNVVFTKHMPKQVRYVPSLIWLQMVVAREKRVRDILATLARAGHRVPRETHEVLKKLWLVMDVASNYQRQVLMKNEDLFSDDDLYVAQLFFVKLSLRLNDPIYGSGTNDLMRALLGQRTGFTPLWQFLRGKGCNTIREMVQIQVRYNLPLTTDQAETALPVFGVPIEQVGVGHLEGWGRGVKHLLRADELVVCESTRRQIDMPIHLEAMVAYGRVDLTTGESLVPTLEDMYMSDDEFDDVPPEKEHGIHGGCGNVPFRYRDWTPKLARKARWDELTEEEKAAIFEEERDEIRVGQAWDDNSEFDFEPYQDDFDIGPDDPSSVVADADISSSSLASIDDSAFSFALTDESASSVGQTNTDNIAWPAAILENANFGLGLELVSGGGHGNEGGGIVLDFSNLNLNPDYAHFDTAGHPEESDAITGSTTTAGSTATASTALSTAADESVDAADNNLKALADMEYTEEELAFDWDGLFAERRDGASYYCEDPFVEEHEEEDEVEMLKNYVRQY